eukprot:g2503.t1
MILERDPECRNSVFATEIVIHEQIMRDAHGILTRNPEEADFFFVPVYAACLVYKDFGLFEKYRFIVKSVLDWIMKKPYWHRSGGRDHIWPLVHDFGACLSWLDNNDRVYFPEMHSSIFLSHLGDLNMGCFQTHRDVVIPPYISSPRIRTAWTHFDDGKERNILAHFRGTVYWQHDTTDPSLLIKAGKSDLYSYGVRQYLLKQFKNDKDIKVYEGGSDRYVEEVLSSKFCLCPRGFAPWSRRLFDAVQLGCIPVIIADGIELPYEEFLDYTSFSVKIAEVEVSNLKQILLSVSESTIRKKREAMWRLKNRFLFHNQETDDDAFDMILWKLSTKAVPYRPVAGREFL